MSTIKWIADPTHSEIGFRIKHLMISNVSGKFGKFAAEVQTAGEDFTTARILATINAASIDTGNPARDEHLQHVDFFEVEKFPVITFQSTHIQQVDAEQYIIRGDLTVKGVTKSIKLDVEHSGVTKDPWGNRRAGFTITAKINRSEFGLTFNTVLETGGVALGDEVKIQSEIQLVKQAAEVTAGLATA